MSVPDLAEMVSPMDPQPSDPSATHGFCSVADIKDVFATVHEVLTAHDLALASLTSQVATLTSDLEAAVARISDLETLTATLATAPDMVQAQADIEALQVVTNDLDSRVSALE